MSDSAAVFVFLPGMFLRVLLFVEIGRRIGVRRAARGTEREHVVESTIETDVRPAGPDARLHGGTGYPKRPRRH